MTKEADNGEEPKKKRGLLLPLLIGLVLAAALGGGGFYAMSSGILDGKSASTVKGDDAHGTVSAAFVPLDPLIVSLGGPEKGQLRFRGHLEVESGHEDEVTKVLPRISDVLNGYLRALDPAVVHQPATLVRVRAQMLRRVQIIVGDGLVRDLLVMEFVLT